MKNISDFNVNTFANDVSTMLKEKVKKQEHIKHVKKDLLDVAKEYVENGKCKITSYALLLLDEDGSFYIIKNINNNLSMLGIADYLKSQLMSEMIEVD
jgi:hypothetical protein